MRRIFIYVTTLAFLICTFTSCSNDNPAYYRDNLLATWIIDTFDGYMLDESDFTVVTYNTNGIITWEGILSQDSSHRRWGSNGLRYDIYCCDLSYYGTYTGLFGYTEDMPTRQEYSFVHTEDSLMTLRLETLEMGGVTATPPFTEVTMRKIPADYAAADSIYGVWQFNLRNQQDFSNHRLQFMPQNQLRMMARVGENSWEPMGGGEDVYNLYHNFIALTIYDNSLFGTAGKWDVKCFSIDSVSIASGRMFLHSGSDEYTLSYISAN